MQTILNLRDATVSHSVGEGEVLSIVLLSNDFLQWDWLYLYIFTFSPYLSSCCLADTSHDADI